MNTRNILYYPPTKEGWDLVCAVKEQIVVSYFNGDMRDMPELALMTGEVYVGFDEVEHYLKIPKPKLSNPPPKNITD